MVLKAGGVDLSFDPPVAHFGLGEYSTMNRIEVHWSTGERTELRGNFDAEARYRITRANPRRKA